MGILEKNFKKKVVPYLTTGGPRPGLWNQDLLTAERDKYGANDVKPGLTGWAQINGRDEIEIPVKAKLDGEYARKIMGLAMDAKVFLGSLHVFGGDDSVVEGGTGEMKKAANDMNGKKRILFLSNHFKTLFWFRKELIQKLVDEGHDVYLSLPEDENNFFANMGCHIVVTDVDRRGVNPKNDFKLIMFYKKMIPEINPDIIFSYTIKPNIYGAMVSGKKYKQICNITGTGATFLEDNMVAKICKMLYRVSVRRCYRVYFQNTGDRDFFIENKLVGKNYLNIVHIFLKKNLNRILMLSGLIFGMISMSQNICIIRKNIFFKLCFCTFLHLLRDGISCVYIIFYSGNDCDVFCNSKLEKI